MHRPLSSSSEKILLEDFSFEIRDPARFRFCPREIVFRSATNSRLKIAAGAVAGVAINNRLFQSYLATSTSPYLINAAAALIVDMTAILLGTFILMAIFIKFRRYIYNGDTTYKSTSAVSLRTPTPAGIAFATAVVAILGICCSETNNSQVPEFKALFGLAYLINIFLIGFVVCSKHDEYCKKISSE